MAGDETTETGILLTTCSLLPVLRERSRAHGPHCRGDCIAFWQSSLAAMAVLTFPEKTPGAALAVVAAAKLAGLALEVKPDPKAAKDAPAKLTFPNG